MKPATKVPLAWTVRSRRFCSKHEGILDSRRHHHVPSAVIKSMNLETIAPSVLFELLSGAPGLCPDPRTTSES